MEWTTVIFSAAVSLPAAALIKYSMVLILERKQRQVYFEAVRQVMREDMIDDILSRIDYVTKQVVTKVMYGERFEVKDKEGKVIGKIGRTDSLEEAGGTDNEVAPADR